MTKLTKTQTEILARANRNMYGRTSVVTGWYTTRKNGGRYGEREFQAASQLVTAGLLVRVGDADSNRSPIRGPRGGYIGTHHGSDFGFQITDAGRAAVAQ